MRLGALLAGTLVLASAPTASGLITLPNLLAGRPAAAPVAAPAEPAPLLIEVAECDPLGVDALAECPPAPVLVVDASGDSPRSSSVLVGATAVPEPPAVAAEEGGEALTLKTYTVQAGDTLRLIAESFGIRNETLIWANDLANPDLLISGTQLLVPPVDGVMHRVQPGDTVANVAIYYGADTMEVIEANGLTDPYIITNGQLLFLPGGEMPMPAPPPVLTPASSSDGESDPGIAPATPDSVEAPDSDAQVQAAEAEEPEPLPIPPSATESQAAFILSIAEAARASQRNTGVPASVCLAQAILESYWGSSRLTREANNYFGIKATSRGGTAGTVYFNTYEHINGQQVLMNEPFRAYLTVEDSFVDHGLFFIENPRYATAMEHTDDPDQFAREIARAGYATAPTYASELIRLMESFNLYAYDVTS